MELASIKLTNFRGFETIQVPLDKRITIIAGINGAGKSTLLDATAIMLSWVIARIRHTGASGRNINDNDINNRSKYSIIELTTSDNSMWTLAKEKKGHARTIKHSDLKFVSEYAMEIKEHISKHDEKCSIPVFIYYPINRAVLDIPLRIRKKHEFSLLETYEESLTSGANFRHFFEWFRNREDLENQHFRNVTNSSTRPTDPQLQTVRRALGIFLPQFQNICVNRNPLSMVVQKGSQEVRIEQLSDGEKCLFALVGDLARRLAIANPILPNPLEGKGIVLVDEIELHLHPSWQRMIIQNLIETFPNCQFIITTHSPQAVGEIPANNLRILYRDTNDKIDFSTPVQSLGLSSSDILEEIMETPRRNKAIANELETIFRLISREEFEESKSKIVELTQKLNGDIPEIVRAKSLLAMLEEEI